MADNPVPQAQIRQELGVPNEAAAGRMDTGQSAWSLIICQVSAVDWERQMVTLRPMTGTREEKPWTGGVPLTFPGGGRRHFMGSMPMVVDF